MLKKLRRILDRSMGNNDIDENVMKQMLRDNKNTILLDVRSKQEYEEGHLSGSILIPIYDLAKEAEKKIPNKEQTIIVYCASGNRSKQAQRILENKGYKDVYNLKGGLEYIN